MMVFEIYSRGTGAVDYIGGVNLSMFTIYGITLDKTEEELIAAFGEPTANYITGIGKVHGINYEISSGYTLDF